MYRTLSLLLLLVLLPPVANASPYRIHYFEDFEDGELDDVFLCPYMVDEPPSDPAQSYALIEAPSWDGSLGLTMIRGEGNNDPSIAIFNLSCRTCGSGTVEVELAAPPGREFGVFELHLDLYEKEFVIVEYTEPGAYTFDIPDDVSLELVIWNGHDVIIDDLRIRTWCSCFTPNEVVTWGALKASYR